MQTWICSQQKEIKAWKITMLLKYCFYSNWIKKNGIGVFHCFSPKNCFSRDITSLIYCYIASSIYKFLSSGKHLIVLYNIFITFHVIWSLFLDIIFIFILHNKANINVIFGVAVVEIIHPSLCMLRLFTLEDRARENLSSLGRLPQQLLALPDLQAGTLRVAFW